MSRNSEKEDWEGILNPGGHEKVGLERIDEQLEFTDYAELRYPGGRSIVLEEDFSESIEEYANMFESSEVDIEYRMQIEGTQIVIEASGREKDDVYPLFAVHAVEGTYGSNPSINGPEVDYAGS